MTRKENCTRQRLRDFFDEVIKEGVAEVAFRQGTEQTLKHARAELRSITAEQLTSALNVRELRRILKP